MTLNNCYIVLYNDEKILLAKQFVKVVSKYNNSKFFWGAKASKAGIYIPHDTKYFAIVHLPARTNPKHLFTRGKILLSDSFPEINTKKKYEIKDISRHLNIAVKRKFFTVTIPEPIYKEI